MKSERIKLRDILSKYSVNQLNHLIGSKWGIRFKGKEDPVQFYLEKLCMECYLKNVFKRLSKNEIELLKLLVIRDEPTSEDCIRGIIYEDKSWAFASSISNLMFYFLIYSSNDCYYVPEELVEPIRKTLGITERKMTIYTDEGIKSSVIKGDVVLDVLAILWYATQNGIEVTQRGEVQKYSMDKLMSIMNSNDKRREPKLRTYLRFLISLGFLHKKENRMCVNHEEVGSLLSGGREELINRILGSCSEMAKLSQGGFYTFKSLRGVNGFLDEFYKLDKNLWYDLDDAIEILKGTAIKKGVSDQWVSLKKEDLKDRVEFLSWLNLCNLSLTKNNRVAFRIRNLKSTAEDKFLIVNPNFEVTLFLDMAEPYEAYKVMVFGSLEKVDVATTISLSKEILWKNLETFGNPLTLFKKHSMKEIPQNVEIYLKEWIENYRSVQIKNAKLLIAEKKSMLDELIIKYPEFLSRVGPKVAMIENEDLIENLKKEGIKIRIG